MYVHRKNIIYLYFILDLTSHCMQRILTKYKVPLPFSIVLDPAPMHRLNKLNIFYPSLVRPREAYLLPAQS